MNRNLSTPSDTSRLVDLDVLLGNRGAVGQRAVRLQELSPFTEQSIKFALANRGNPKSMASVLAADVAMSAASTWATGPSLTLTKGVWSVAATVLIKSSVAGIAAVRLQGATGPLFASQASHPATANNFIALNLAGPITISETQTITLEAAPSVTSATIFMVAQTTVAGAINATRLSAVQIGA